MEKTGWQVTAGILALIAVGGMFGTVANKRAADHAMGELESARNAKRETVIVTEVHREPCLPDPPAIGRGPYPPGAQCIGGVLLQRTAKGWESITHAGKAITCK